MNSFVLTPLAWRACEQSELLSLRTSFTVSTHLSTTACVAMVGYTLWDSLVLFRYRAHWSSVGMYAVHHAGSVVAWGLCAVSGYAHVIVCHTGLEPRTSRPHNSSAIHTCEPCLGQAVPALLFEATAPFVNARYFLATAGLKESVLYTINGVLMFLSFFVVR